VNNSGDISWRKNRVFLSEVFRFEDLGFELITQGLYRAFFQDMDIGELNVEELRFRAIRRADNEVGLATIHSAMSVQGISETPGPLDSASFSTGKMTETGGGIERELRRRLRQ
jgi:hypothetical protein